MGRPLALRTQQIIAHESGVADTIDPLAGSYYLEYLTDQLEEEARSYIDTIDEMGGMLEAIESGYVQREIQESAYQYQRALENDEDFIVGVNRFIEEEENKIALQKLDPSIEGTQRHRLIELRQRRDDDKASQLRKQLSSAAQGKDNLMP